MNKFLLIISEARHDKELIPLIKGNPNQKELMKLCRMIGVEVGMNGKGEFLLYHPSQGTKPIILSTSRRKDTPWGVIDWLNRVIRTLNIEKTSKMAVKASDLKESTHDLLCTYPDSTVIDLPDGGHVIKNSSFTIYLDKDDEYHREDGPAVINMKNNYFGYYIHGKRHRLDGPAVTNAYHEYYYVKGKLFTKEEFYKHFADG